MSSAGTGDRLRAALEALVLQFTRRSLFHASWKCRIVAQHADYTVDLIPESSTMPGHEKVEIVGLPGVKVKVAAGARCLLEFRNGDPQRPIATLFETDSLKELTITADTKVTVNAPAVDLGPTASAGVARIGDIVQVVVAVPGVIMPVVGGGGGACTIPALTTFSGMILSGQNAVKA